MNVAAMRARCSRSLWMSALVFVAVLPANALAGEISACQGIVIEAEGGQLDDGWSGEAHDQDLAVGGSTSWSISQCSAGDKGPCLSDSDCSAGTCVASCDCASDTSCQISGPLRRQCLANMADCTTNADCPSSGACVRYFGPPQPLSYLSSPVCALTHFDGAASGTYDTTTGDLSISGTTRRRYYLGNATAEPCPLCGAPADNPEVGDQFVCKGGANNAQPCTVEAVTPFYGGTSSDCPPAAFSIVGGASGAAIRLDDFGSAPKTRTAKLPCTALNLTGNPTVPGSNPKCTDTPAGAVCTSNADCKRCSDDPTTPCANNADCAGKGSCAEAPDQPITCGYWCHCGFCNNDGTKPCFETSDCAEGETCQKGTGSVSQTNGPQTRPNDCSSDSSICGMEDVELCKNTQDGSCSLAPFRDCETNGDCQNFNAGDCIVEDRSCFGPSITRAGEATPLGSNCAFEEKQCNSNADCQGEGDFCVASTSRAFMVGLHCLPGTTSSSVNNVAGFPGPGTLALGGFVKACRCEGDEPGCELVCADTGVGCGNGTVDGEEDCDGGACCDENCMFRSSATVCRANAGVCDVPESCTGSTADCPGNGFAATTTSCRTSAGNCDVAEVCNGLQATCPADAFAATTTACRASAGICDVAESCSGTAAACPGDTFAATTVGCRASAGECDAAESCSGSAATCPADGDEPDDTVCDDGNACTSSDQCTDGTCAGTAIPECGAECGNGTVEGSEACDDGNATFTVGEYCGVACVLIPCGKPTNSSGVLPKSSDALFVLKAAVGQITCSPRVCSPDGNQSVVSSDALRVLRAAVEQPVTLDCPTS